LSGNGQLSLSSNTTAEAVVDAVGYFAHDLPTWTVTLRDEANRLASEYTVPPSGQGSISRVRSHLYLGNLLVATRNSTGGYTYFASDHLGTPRVGTGANPETHKYQPFGTEITAFGSLPIKFAAMERDLSSGNDFDHARYQSSLLGRFLGPDFVGGSADDPQTWNRYTYARNNPLKYLDPDGNAFDTFFDVAFVAYDLFDIGRSVVRGQGVSGTQLLALGGDVLGAAIPFATGIGAAVRAERGIVTFERALIFKGAPEVADARLRGIVSELFRASDTVKGGTAGAVRDQLGRGMLVGGKDHIVKALERSRQLDNLLAAGGLSQRDRRIAQALATDLRNALRPLLKDLKLNEAELLQLIKKADPTVSQVR
jgi:RHS repeat-associated protein